MEPTLDFWFEFASTYSYPAAVRIADAAGRAGVRVQWRPFLLGPIFGGQGWNDSPFNIYPAKGRYMWRDLERICAKLEVPFRHPSQFPRNGLLAARVACANAGEPWAPDFVRGVYRANFAEDRDIAHPEVVAGVLRSLGLQAEQMLEGAQTPAAKQRLREQTDEAIQLGVFGAPTFIVGGELFWGNDRLEDAIAWSRRS